MPPRWYNFGSLYISPAKPVRVICSEASREAIAMNEKIRKSEAEWRSKLTDQQYQVTRQKGTEPPFTGEYEATESKGTYVCVCCGQPLFSSETKYHSGSGWPSYWQPIAAEN